MTFNNGDWRPQLMGHIFHKLLLILNIAINFVQEAIDVNVQVTPFVITARFADSNGRQTLFFHQVQCIIKILQRKQEIARQAIGKNKGNY